jgi:hypothetical protein
MIYRNIVLLGMLWISLAGCTPRVQPVQPSQTDLVELDAAHPVGQTFVARFDGLSGILISISPDQVGGGEVILHLLSEPGADDDLAQVVLSLSQVTQAQYYRFDFPPLSNSSQQYYYAWLEVTGAGRLMLAASAGSTYQDGALYQQGTPRDGQLAFSLEYEPVQLTVGLGQELTRWAGVLGLCALLFILPGWAVLGWLWRGWQRLTWMEKACLSIGFSLALYVVLLLLTDLARVHLGAGYAWGAIVLGLVGVIWQALSQGGLRAWYLNLCQAIKDPIKSLTGRLPDVAFVLMVGLIFITRWWAIREIEAPMWGDSVHHTFITQLILDNGGLFQSWEPYAAYGSFGNQFGFPAAAALLAWISGLDASQATLWMGQVLNGLAVMALYPLAVRITQGERWAGVGAVLAAGLLSGMPAFYFNWGRYAQLAGQVILPVVLWMTWDVIDDVSANKRGFRSLLWAKLCLTGVALSGMVMTQFRTPFFYLTFILACVLGWWLPSWRLDIRRWMKACLQLGLVVLIGVVLFLPLGASMLSNNISDIASSDVSRETLRTNLKIGYQEWRNLIQYVPLGLILGALVGWLWGLVKKAWLVIVVGLWVPWLASVYAWIILGVPGVQQMASFAVLISLYIPAGLLFGYLFGQIARLLKRWILAEAFLLLIVGMAGFWLAWEQRTVATPQTYAMVTRPDMRAMNWIRENTDPDARFLVEGFRAFYNASAVGSDAGWWLPLLAGRDNTMPPLYALSSEVPLEDGYSKRVVDLVAALETIPLDSVEGAALLCEQGISHVYIGQLQGLVGISWLSQLFSPDELLNQPFYQLVYHQDRVYIFALQEGVCDE